MSNLTIGLLSNYPLPNFYKNNLVLWLDATDATTVKTFSSTTTVSAWLDKSGKGANFYAHSGGQSYSPTLIPGSTTTLGGSSTVYLSGASISPQTCLSCDKTWGNSLTGQLSIFFAFAFTGKVYNATFLSQSYGTTATNILFPRRKLQIQAEATTTPIKFMQGNDDPGDGALGDKNIERFTGNADISASNFIGVTTDSTTQGFFNINRTVYTDTSGTLTYGLTSNNCVWLGVSRYGPNYSYPAGTIVGSEYTNSMQLSEMLVYNTNLPHNISTGIIKYLQTKYKPS